MPEEKQELKETIREVKYFCDECKNGEMKAGDVELLSLPPQYPHTCDRCGYQRIFNRRYPYIEREYDLVK